MLKKVQSYLNENGVIQWDIINVENYTIHHNKYLYQNKHIHYRIEDISAFCLEGQEQNCIKFLSRKWLQNIHNQKISKRLIKEYLYHKDCNLYNLKIFLNNLTIQFENCCNYGKFQRGNL